MFIIPNIYSLFMEVSRLKRYADKIKIIRKRKGEVEEWANEFLEDEKTMLACYKAFQEITEASMDILAMTLKDDGLAPKDDYSNIDLVFEKKILDKKVSGALKEANGLRNRIIHGYNGLNAKTAYESLLELLPFFDDFLAMVEKWLKKK